MSKIKESKTLQNVLWTILILLVWEIVSRTEIVNSYILPPFPTPNHIIISGRIAIPGNGLNNVHKVIKKLSNILE